MLAQPIQNCRGDLSVYLEASAENSRPITAGKRRLLCKGYADADVNSLAAVRNLHRNQSIAVNNFSNPGAHPLCLSTAFARSCAFLYHSNIACFLQVHSLPTETTTCTRLRRGKEHAERHQPAQTPDQTRQRLFQVRIMQVTRTAYGYSRREGDAGPAGGNEFNKKGHGLYARDRGPGKEYP